MSLNICSNFSIEKVTDRVFNWSVSLPFEVLDEYIVDGSDISALSEQEVRRPLAFFSCWN